MIRFGIGGSKLKILFIPFMLKYFLRLPPWQWKTNEKGNFSSHITDQEVGRCFTLKGKNRIGTRFPEDTFGVHLIAPKSYIIVHDPKFYYFSSKTSSSLPGFTVQKTEQNKVFYQNIELVLHRKRNTESNPCNEDKKYILGDCLKDAVQRKVGCRMLWNEGMEELDDCFNISQYEHYFNLYSTWTDEDFEKLSLLSGCLAPCFFTEVVPVGVQTFDELLTLNGTTLFVMTLAKRKLTVRTEERYPDFASLVADIGGTLGLFLGFSFLMLWELVINIATKCIKMK